MKRDILVAALSVLNAYATNEPPDVIEVAVITAHNGNPDEIPRTKWRDRCLNGT